MLEQPPVDQFPEKNQPKTRPDDKSKLIWIGNSLLIFIAVFGTFGALVSSFSLNVDMSVTNWLWLIGAFVISIITMRYRGKGLIILFCSALILFLFYYREIIDGYKIVVREITTLYSRWIPMPVLFSDALLDTEEPTIFIAAVGIIITILLSFSICLRRSLLTTLLITAPIVFLTFVITDLQAELIYLFCVIVVYLTLLICSAVCPDDYIKRGKVLFPALISAMAVMVVAYMLAPHGNYSREENIAAIGNRFRTVISRISGLGSLWQSSDGADFGWLGTFDYRVWQFNTTNVSITNAGHRSITNQSLLEIVVNEPGTFYLRGYSMLSFNGSSWRISDEAARMTGDETARAMPAMIADLNMQLNPYNPPHLTEMVITRTGDLTPDITYQPYYTGDFLSERETINITAPVDRFFYIENDVHSLLEELDEIFLLLSEAYSSAIIREDRVAQDELLYILNYPINYPLDELSAYADYIFRTGVYTSVDVFTARHLRQLALDAGIDPDAERNVIADAVSKFVIESGRYSLSPDLSVPANEDFALYFLQNAEEGYCIHFATAAVLMLRSLDVPARFTSGYVVTVRPSDVGKTVMVTDRNAHAWVEVFYDDIGWLYLEVTPGGGNSIVPPPRPHTPDNNVTATPTPSPTPPPIELTPPPQENSDPDVIEEPSTGVASTDDRQGVNEIPDWVYNIGIVVACIIVCLVSLIIRRSISKKRRINSFKQKNTNKAALYIWRYITSISNSNEAQPRAIESLALKARFSQHQLTTEERDVMIDYAKNFAEKVYKRQTNFGRFWLKYIQALY